MVARFCAKVPDIPGGITRRRIGDQLSRDIKKSMSFWRAKYAAILAHRIPNDSERHCNAGVTTFTRALRAQPVGRLHPSQPPHSGGSDGVFDGPRAQVVAVAYLTLFRLKINLWVSFSAILRFEAVLLNEIDL